MTEKTVKPKTVAKKVEETKVAVKKAATRKPAAKKAPARKTTAKKAVRKPAPKKTFFEQFEDSRIAVPFTFANKTFMAGLGLFTVVQKELDKRYTAFDKKFDKYAKDGEKVFDQWEDKVEDFRKDVEKRVDEARGRVRETFKKAARSSPPDSSFSTCGATRGPAFFWPWTALCRDLSSSVRSAPRGRRRMRPHPRPRTVSTGSESTRQCARHCHRPMP